MIKIKSDKIILNESLFDGYLYVENGKIVEISKQDRDVEESYDYAGKYVSAGFIDIHTHGAGGYAFMNSSVEDVEIGDVHFVEVYKDDQLVKAEEYYQSGESYTYVSRVRDNEGYVTAATYYTITLVEDESDGGAMDENAVASYKSVTVEKAEAEIFCEKDTVGESYKGKDRRVEIVNGEIKYLELVGNKRYAKSSKYENGIFTVETTDGRTYYVKYTDDNQNVIITDELEDLA